MMPVEPDIEDGGPTREQSGKGAFSHNESKSPKPILNITHTHLDSTDERGLCDVRLFGSTDNLHEMGGSNRSPQRRAGFQMSQTARPLLLPEGDHNE